METAMPYILTNCLKKKNFFFSSVVMLFYIFCMNVYYYKDYIKFLLSDYACICKSNVYFYTFFCVFVKKNHFGEKNEWEKGELKKKGEFHDKNNEKGNQKLSIEAGQ